MAEDEEYEIVPVSPLRNLERRMEKLETLSTNDPKSIIRDIIDIIRMNQGIVDELVKSNDALKLELSKLPSKLDEMTSQLRELVVLIKSSGEEESVSMSQESMKPVVDKLDELIKANRGMNERNDSVVELLDEISKRIKKPMMPSRLPRPILQPPTGAPPMMRLPLKKPGQL